MSDNAITDRLIIPVKGNVDDWKEDFKQFLLALKEQPGFLRFRWGPRSEDMGVLDLLTGWASTEQRDAFLKSAAHDQALEKMKNSMNGPVTHYTIKFKPYAPREVINSPIVEMVTIRNCTGSEDDLRAAAEKAYGLPGARGGSSGFSVGEVAGHGKVFIIAVGWDSIEASKAAGDSYIPNGVGDVETHHVNYNFPIKGFSVTNTE